MKVIIGQVSDVPNGNQLSFNVGFFDSGGPVEVWNFDIFLTESTTEKDLKELIETEILAHSVNESYGMTGADIVYAVPSFLHGSPQAAIADTTDVSDTADKVNLILGSLRTLGIIAT